MSIMQESTLRQYIISDSSMLYLCFLFEALSSKAERYPCADNKQVWIVFQEMLMSSAVMACC